MDLVGRGLWAQTRGHHLAEHVLPGVRFAVDAYINFGRRAPWQEAVCSSLTEFFAPEIHKERLSNWPQHYPWIDQSGYAYFRKRLSEARRDVEHGLMLRWISSKPASSRCGHSIFSNSNSTSCGRCWMP